MWYDITHDLKHTVHENYERISGFMQRVSGNNWGWYPYAV